MYLKIITFLIVGVIGPCAVALQTRPLIADDDVGIAEIEVIGRRLPPAASEPLFASTVVDKSFLRRSPGLRLDDVLRAVPGFGLFRRQPSRAAHPTTQGVTLRGLGATGAGRTLVMLDGIPQNDPFGGWLDWSRLPAENIESAVITKGGGAGPWGNSALAGVVRLQGRVQDAGHAWSNGRAGNQNTFEAAAGASAGFQDAVISASAHGHTTDGSYLVPAAQRGPVDRRADNRGFGGDAQIAFPIDDATHATVRGSYSKDRLINGTDPARSRSRITDGSLSVVHERGADRPAFQFNAYARDQSFSAIFASVDAQRSAATPVLDQFAVPASAFGSNFVARIPLQDGLSLEAGADIRVVGGTANELFQNFGQGFLRQRSAGGDQWVAGAFTELTSRVDPRTTISAAIRLDAWRQYHGQRRESVLADGSLLRDDQFAPSHGTVVNGRFGVRHQFTDAFAARAVVYSGFRVPTLNELYRPFRVGNDITEANTDLKPERIFAGDIGIEWDSGNGADFSLTYFRARLKDAIANITIRTVPGLDPDLGVFVPAGGVLRQRRNLERITADGIEADFSTPLAENMTLTARYLWSWPRVARSFDQPALVGNRLAQVAKHQGFLGVSVDVTDRWTVDIQARAASTQFEDDLNERSLKSYVVSDISAGYVVNDNATAYVTAENLFNRRIETGVSAVGLLSIGPSRLITAGLRLTY
ncbi:MAG: TonB-dependent receptor [Rhodobacteraceae bacterium]|nr:TonB-dependent receptor [Paracoccaceae bacterium]